MDVVFLVGRILFAAVFVITGTTQLAKSPLFTPYAKAKGVPAAGLAVLAGGALMLVAGIMVALGVWGDLGALLLVVYLLPTTLIMHAFWRETEEQVQQLEIVQFQKNTALIGGALLLFTLYGYAGVNFGLTLTSPLIHLSK